MSKHRITQTTLEERLPSTLREQLSAEGLPEDHLPDWDWITAHTRYSAQGLHNKCKECYGQTLHEFLRSQGFGAISSDGEWPTDDEETINSFEYAIDSLKNRRQWDEITIEGFETVINQSYEAISDEELHVELLDLGYYEELEEEKENIQKIITILDYLRDDRADSTMENYVKELETYYQISYNKFAINMNPVSKAKNEYEWLEPVGETKAISAEQISELWQALNALDECPLKYDLAEWRLWMKALIVYLVSVGPRTSEIIEPNIVESMQFGSDPLMHFEERKNLRDELAPERVPMMAGTGFLEAYVDYIKLTGQKPKVVPSPETESGSRTEGTLNNWIETLCKIADVRVDDDKAGPETTYPSLKHFRRFWKTNYKIAVHKNRSEIAYVADEGGTDTPRTDEENYIDDQVNRKHLRECGREHFEDVIDIEDLPEVMKDAGLDPNEYLDRTTRLDEWGD